MSKFFSNLTVLLISFFALRTLPGQSATPPAKASAGAQTKSTVGNRTASQPTQLTPESLRTNGLKSAGTLKAIYIGDFAHAGTRPTSLQFTSFLSSYMGAFSDRCASELPQDKVPITVKSCAEYRQPVNQYGAPVGVRTCAQPSRTAMPGQFADPDLFDAYLGIEDSANQDVVTDLLGSILNGNSNSTSKSIGDTTSTLQTSEDDAKALINLNGCKSPSLKRLQANMVRFAEDKEAITMTGSIIDN
jgi:hypothetical protein